MEVKTTFDDLLQESRKVQDTIDISPNSSARLSGFKLGYMAERRQVTKALKSVRDLADRLLQQLAGEDARKADEKSQAE